MGPLDININPSAPSSSGANSISLYYQIETVRTRARYVMYSFSYLVVLSYALWNAGKLGRPEKQVSYECAALMTVLLFGLPLLYKPFLALIALMKQLKELEGWQEAIPVAVSVVAILAVLLTAVVGGANIADTALKGVAFSLA